MFVGSVAPFGFFVGSRRKPITKANIGHGDWDKHNTARSRLTLQHAMEASPNSSLDSSYFHPKHELGARDDAILKIVRDYKHRDMAIYGLMAWFCDLGHRKKTAPLILTKNSRTCNKTKWVTTICRCVLQGLVRLWLGWRYL